MERVISAAIATFTLILGSISATEETPQILPIWIWTDEPVDEFVEFQHEFANDRLPEKALARVTGDFCHIELKLNGKLIGRIEAFDPVAEFDLLPFYQLEFNEISIVAYPVEGPSAVAFTLTHDYGNGEFTDTTYEGWSQNATVERGEVTPFRWGDNELRDIAPSAEYNQWKEAFADASAFELSDLPEGFSVEPIRYAYEEEDSWVSMAIDSQDRILIGMETKGILRVTPGGPTQKIKQVEVLNEDLEECRGLVFHDGDLYANANDSKSLYRLRDTNGDDQFDQVTLIQETEGSVGHGRNDLALAPDWTVHAIHGDSVVVPERGKFQTAAEDPESRPLGHWLSLGRDGSDWTIQARGLRNPYGLDFDRWGEAFTYDADNEGDVGLPFYRPSRINHLVRGANYGWWQRPGNKRSIPVYAPDSVPTTFDVGRGSPTSVKFGYRSRFPEPWNKALFALDWAYGRIIAVHLTPRGASYYASGSEFLTGRPLNVTDLDFDSHGRMYFVAGGRKTRSALFRLDYTGDPRPVERTSEQARLREAFSLGRREIRKRLESNTAPIDDDSECWAYLSSNDPWLRNAARVRIESRPLEEWRELVGTPDSSLGELTALLALVRQGEGVDRKTALENALVVESTKWRRHEKLTLLRIAELAASEDTVSTFGTLLQKKITPWITTPDSPVTREVLRNLALYESPEGPFLATDLFTKSTTQEDKLYYLERLSEMNAGWSEGKRVQFLKAIAAAKQTSRGDRFMPPFFAAIEERALKNAPVSKQEEYAALLAPSAPAPDEELPLRDFVRHWTMEDFDDSAFTTFTVAGHSEGLALFRAGLCHYCHIFGTEGQPVGPDLSRVNNRFSPQDLLLSILHPSEVISEVYRNTEVEKTDGTQVLGLLVRDDFRESTLHFATNPFDPSEQVTVSKSEVAKLTESSVSPMPTNLLSTFTKEEVITLLQWLLQGPSAGESTGSGQ